MTIIKDYDLIAECVFDDDYNGSKYFNVCIKLNDDEREELLNNEKEYVIDMCNQIVEKYDRYHIFEEHEITFIWTFDNLVYKKQYNV